MIEDVIDYVRRSPMKVGVMWMVAYIINQGLDMVKIDRNSRNIEIPIITDKIFEMTGQTVTICPQTQLVLKQILSDSNASLSSSDLFIFDMIAANDYLFVNYITLIIMQYMARMM
jgi:hypothetical protein